MAPIVMMNQGIPNEERRFWQSMSVCRLYDLYKAMLTTPSKLLQMIEEPFFNSPSEECVFGYLQQHVYGQCPEVPSFRDWILSSRLQADHCGV